jgi:hypothetical protein
LYSAIAASGEAKDVELERTINVLSGALQALTESSKDPCPICAEQTKKKAFEVINTELAFLAAAIFVASYEQLNSE